MGGELELSNCPNYQGVVLERGYKIEFSLEGEKKEKRKRKKKVPKGITRANIRKPC